MRFLPALSTLQLALGLSVAVHAAVLTIRFVNPEAFNRVLRQDDRGAVSTGASRSTSVQSAN